MVVNCQLLEIVSGIVGETDESDMDRFYIWTHRKLEIGYNGQQIVDVNLTSENKVKLSLDATVDFTYQVGISTQQLTFLLNCSLTRTLYCAVL